MIEKLVPYDDSEFKWMDEDGHVHKNKKDYLQENVLGMCGCGNPDSVMRYIRDFLVKLDSKEWGEYEDLPYMFLCYWANDRNLAEHGTTVRCSWLKNKGKELLNDINWCLENEPEEE